MSQRPLLSISILVSNRIDTVEKTLSSLKPLLDSIPSELVVVDTVGPEKTDGSLEVAKKYATKIVHFDWINDFAAARNAGLRECTGEWFMFMDDDEWFDDIAEMTEFFRSGEYKHYKSATYKIHDYLDFKGHYSVADVKRLVQIESDTWFEGKVHEHFPVMRMPIKELKCYINHYGYAFETEEAKKRHFERNVGILKPMYESDPWNMHNRMQLVQEYISMPEYCEEAEKICLETIDIDDSKVLTAEGQWIVVHYVTIRKDDEVILQRCTEIKKKAKLTSFTRLIVDNFIIKTSFKLGRFKEAADAGFDIIGQYEELKNKKETVLVQSITEEKKYISDGEMKEVLGKAVVALKKLGEYKRAQVIENYKNTTFRQPILSISLLVSNRKDTVEKCLSSIKKLLDSFSSELIIVDTIGSEKTDGSLDIAKKYATKVVHYDWNGDFSAARNAGLCECTGEWFMFIDDDEWFEAVDEIVDFFKTGQYLEYNSAVYRIRNYKNFDGTSYDEADVLRLVKRQEDLSFIGKVHERLNTIQQPCKHFNDFVHHYGYVYKTEEDRLEHIKRNRVGLFEMLEDNPKSLEVRCQVALELATYDNEGALKLCEDTLEVCKEERHEPGYQWIFSLIFCLYEALEFGVDNSVNKYNEYKAQWPINEAVDNAICLELTRMYLIENRPAEACVYCDRYFETYDYLMNNHAEKEKQIVADLAKHISLPSYLDMIEYAAYCHTAADDLEKAWYYYGRMPWEIVTSNKAEALQRVFDLAEYYTDVKVLYGIIKRIVTNTNLKTAFGVLMQNPIVKARINDTLSKMRG